MTRVAPVHAGGTRAYHSGMTTRKLGNSDLAISPVGFGAWAIGGEGWAFSWGPQDDRDSIAAIHRSLELGVNWIDTAAVYGLGHSEEVVARALSEWSGSRPYVFTKCSRVWDAHRQISTVLKTDSILRECEASLKRLKTDVIDLYQIHWPSTTGQAENDEGWSAMQKLKQQGKIRWAGVSNWNVDQLRRAAAIAAVTSLQPPYSLIRRDIESEILPYCHQHGIGTIVYSPMASGMLTGAMTRERIDQLPETDFRKRSKNFQEPLLSKHLAAAERVKAVARRLGRTPGEVAIAWTLRHPGVTGAIVGARNAKQAEGVMRAGEVKLSDADAAELSAD
jgi:aryl-alcohol dehydrogenase-like predicted oxidoreductase